MNGLVRKAVRGARRWFKETLPRALGTIWQRFRDVDDLFARELNHWGVSQAPVGRRLGWWRRGFLSESVVTYGISDVQALDEYLSDYHRFVRTGRINEGRDDILSDKLIFYLCLRAITPRVAPVVGLIHQVRYLPVAEAGSPVSLEEALRKLGTRAVLKPNTGCSGQGIIFHEHDERGHRVNGRPMPWPELVRMLKAESFVVSPVVQQASYAAEIFPKTSNTIRILTMWDYVAGETFIAAAVHRFGTEASGLVDNFSGGGLSAAIDPKDGRLGKAASFPMHGRVTWWTEHPDSDVTIEGTLIPQWSVISTEILTIARHLSLLPYIAWDILPTESGFSIIEGNTRTDVNLFQVHGPLLADEKVRRFYEHHGVLRPRQ